MSADRKITKEVIVALGVDAEKYTAEDSRKHFAERDTAALKALEIYRRGKGIISG